MLLAAYSIAAGMLLGLIGYAIVLVARMGRRFQ